MSISADQLRTEFDRVRDDLRKYVENRLPAGVASVVTADDVVQEVWLTASRSSGSVRHEAAVGYWLQRITERKLIDTLRYARCRKRGGGRLVRPDRSHTSYLNLFWRVAATDRSPSSVDAAREAVDAVKSALHNLPDDYRKAMTLYHIDGLSRGEVGRAMNRSPAAVNSMLHRGILMLREVLGAPGKFFSHG